MIHRGLKIELLHDKNNSSTSIQCFNAFLLDSIGKYLTMMYTYGMLCVYYCHYSDAYDISNHCQFECMFNSWSRLTVNETRILCVVCAKSGKKKVGCRSLFTRDNDEARIQKNKSEQNNTMMNDIQNDQHPNNIWTSTLAKLQFSNSLFPQYCIIPLPDIDIADGLTSTKGSTISSLNVKFHVNGLLNYWYYVADEYAINWKVSGSCNIPTVKHQNTQ